jgi:SAM-dependent MidA family methyltransferase
LNTAVEQIRAEIGRRGAISFADFMDLALYCPDCGYYENEKDTAGHRGDFYTSVSVGPLFGELLAFQFADWLEAEFKCQKSAVRIVEAGAHDGRLARDILTWLKLRRPALLERTEYWIVEPSVRRRGWQLESLKEFAPRVRWFSGLRSMGTATGPENEKRSPGVRGIIFSNELLDAMPAHRLGWNAKCHEWFEWGVTVQGERFVWCRLPASDCATRFTQPASITPGLRDVLPDGFTTELCPAAENWWREAAGLLQHGKLLTLDYGLSAEDFFSPQRANGTLRAYRRHQLADDVLANAGEQDLTAHVNFTAIQQAGAAAGLKTESFLTQARFLTAIAQRAWKTENNFDTWTQDCTRQFQTLTHPNHLGRAFQVLVQSRGNCSS